MKISQVTDNEIAVSDYRPLPGQMSGLGQMSNDSDLLLGLGTFGQLTQRKPGLLDAIKKSAASTNKAVAAQQKQKLAAAKSSPVAAAAIFAKAKMTAQPGTNVQKGIIGALNKAAKDATIAQKKRAQAQKLLAQGDKRGAAAASVQYLTAARNAAILATKAEKTKVAHNLDVMAKRLDEAGKKAQSAADIQIRKSGPTPTTDRLKAVANQMAENVKKLRAQSAAVQDAPDSPPGVPTPQRIAEVANKFNIRTTMKSGWAGNKAMISVLSDSMDSALAQANDYEGAIAYYGNDVLGKLAADIEYGNYSDFVAGLYGVDASLGQLDFLKKIPGVGAVVSKGEELVKKASDVYNNNVKPLVDRAASAVGIKPTPPKVTPPAPAPARAAPALPPPPPAAAPEPAAPAAGSKMAGKMPIIVGGVAAAVVIGYFVMKR